MLKGGWTLSLRRPATWVLFVALAGIAHIVTVLTLARSSETSALIRLHEASELNVFSVLQPISPDRQPLPFLMPENVYAVCPFDVSKTPVRINALLASDGWLLSLHELDGTSFYFAPGSAGENLAIELDVVPAGDALNGLELAARPDDMKIAKVEAPSPRGIAVLRAPVRGRAYLGKAVKLLDSTSCRPIGRQLVRR